MTSTPDNPNSQPLPAQQVEYSDTERSCLDIHEVDAWRAHEHGILADLREADPNFMAGAYIQLFRDNVDDSLDDYLAQQGLDKDAPGYKQVREIYRNASLDKIRDEQWYTSPAARNEDPSKTASERDLVIDTIRTEVMASEAATNEKETTVEKLNKLRESKHKAYVTRLKGPLFGKKRRENDEAYTEAERAYNKALGERLEERIAELQAEGKSDDEIKQFLKEQANEFARGDEAAQKAELLERSGRLGLLLERYANADRKTKIIYGLGLGAVAAATGVGAGLLVGAAFGAVGGATLAGMAATGSGLAWKGFGAFRTYHMRRADIFKNEKLAEFELKDGATAEGERRRLLEFLSATSEAQLKKGERIKKWAMGFAIGSVVVGTTVGIAAHAVLADGGDWIHWRGGQVEHWWGQSHSPSGGENGYDGVGTGAGPNSGTGMGIDPDGRAPWPQPPETLPPPGGAGQNQAEAIEDYIREHAAASKIDNGEGWYQTLKELGVKHGDWHELLQKVGPKLHDIRYGGVRAAYWDAENHEWRINMTDNHKMSPEALKLIVQEANKEGALKHALDLSTNTTAPSPEFGAETPAGVKLWHGAAPEQVLQEEYPGLTSHQAFIDVDELYDKLGPKNVFEGITLSEHSHNDIWFNQDAGMAKLTPDAQSLWDQMHPEENALTQAIAEGRASNITIATNGEHWSNVIDKLKQAGITDVAKDKYRPVLRQLWPQIKGLEYTDGTPVASLNRHGELIMNESPTKVLHPEALRRLVRLLYKNHYDLVS